MLDYAQYLSDILCIIPARGDSKGIPRKNVQLLGGIPLISHTIRSAIGTKLPVLVSSDDAEILRIADAEGAHALKRPSYLAAANSSSESVLIHALDEIQKDYAHLLLLQPTSPFRLEGTIDGFLKYYFDGSYDSALTATKFYDFFWRLSDGKWISSYDPANRPMRQQLGPTDFRYFDNGNMYLTRTDMLRESNNRLSGDVGVYPISELEGMQIDTPKDLEICRAIFEAINGLSEDKSCC